MYVVRFVFQHCLFVVAVAEDVGVDLEIMGFMIFTFTMINNDQRTIEVSVFISFSGMGQPWFAMSVLVP